MQHAKLGLQTEIISVCVLLDLDLKVITVMRVRNPLQFFQVEQKINAWPISFAKNVCFGLRVTDAFHDSNKLPKLLW